MDCYFHEMYVSVHWGVPTCVCVRGVHLFLKVRGCVGCGFGGCDRGMTLCVCIRAAWSRGCLVVIILSGWAGIFECGVWLCALCCDGVCVCGSFHVHLDSG